MTIVDISVAASADDGTAYSNGTYTITGTVVNLCTDASGTINQNGFFRFLVSGINNSETVASAYVQFVAGGTDSGTGANLNIYGEAADNAAQITSAADFDSRSVGSPVAWSGIANWTSGNTYQTPDISSVIQAVINRAGWSNGNAIQLLFKNNASTASRIRRPSTWDHATNAAPVLHIETSSGQPMFTRRGGLWAPTNPARKVGGVSG